jgi:hypothetical protein
MSENNDEIVLGTYTTIQMKKTLAEDFRTHCRRRGYVISARLEKIVLEYLSGSIGKEIE